MKKRWMPFRMLPGSWGLVGDAYKEAEAYYKLEGEDLERRLVEIRYQNEPKVLAHKILDIDLKFNKIDGYHHATKIVELTYEDEDERWLHQIDVEVRYDKLSTYEAEIKRAEYEHEAGPERELEILRIKHEHGHIEKNDYEKRRANLKKEPWVSFVNSGFNPEEGIDGVFFELDWNEHWVEFLKLHGFVGHTDEQIVEDWFSEVCRSYTQPSGSPANFSGYPMGYSKDL